MARGIARGKALVAKLRANPRVRNAEALAAWLGRRKKARQAAKGSKGGGAKTEAKTTPNYYDDDPFAEDYGDEPKPKQDAARERRASSEGGPAGRWSARKAVLSQLEYKDRGGSWKKIAAPIPGGTHPNRRSKSGAPAKRRREP